MDAEIKKEGQVIYPEGTKIPDSFEPYVRSKGVVKGFAKPAVNKLTYREGGKEFTVTLKISAKLTAIWKRYYLSIEEGVAYDPASVLKKAEEDNPYMDSKTGVIITNPLAENFPKSVSPLSAEEVEKRLAAFVTLLCRCVLEENIKAVMEKTERKKNGGLYKRRTLHLAVLDLVDQQGDTYELVAKNEDDTSLTLELRAKVPVTTDLLEHDFLF